MIRSPVLEFESRRSGRVQRLGPAPLRRLWAEADVNHLTIPAQIVENGRVEMWRGGCRLNISVAASFVWRCLSGSAMAPFPHPAHRTGQADLPHPALGQDLTPLLSRATPSAVS